MEREQSEFCNLKALQCSEMASNSAVKNTGREIDILYVYEPLMVNVKYKCCVYYIYPLIFFNVFLYWFSFIYYILYPLTVY